MQVGDAVDRPAETILGSRVLQEWVEGAPRGTASGAEGLRTLASQPGEQTRPYGARDAFARQVQLLVADNRNKMLAEFNSPENVKAYLDAVTEGAKRKDRTCIRMLHEIYDLAGVKNAMVMEFLARVGLSTLEEVEGKIARIKDAQTMDARQRATACVEYLEKFLNANPSERGMFVRRLGGEVPVTSDSYATVVEGK